jgi:hypothetical protein
MAAEISNRTPYALAGIADCGGPDSAESPGAALLLSVASDVISRYHNDGVDDDAAREIANSAPSVYTPTRWAEFVDLAAYQEECEAGDWPTDLTDAAGAALYQIAYRLADALMTELSDAIETDESNADDDDDAETHSAECAGCVHDCPRMRTAPAPLGAPYCDTCADHHEASDDDAETV